MLLAALRDLQWRRQRFLVAVIGTGLAFAMGLLMTGLSEAFEVEVDRTLTQSGGDRWIAPAGAAGPFSAGINIPLQLLPDDLAAAGGVSRADPVLFTRAVAVVDGRWVDVNLFGVRPGGLGGPSPSTGRAPVGPGEVMVPRRVAGIGDTIRILSQEFVVVGTVGRATLIGGAPSLFVDLAVAQRLMTDGNALASMIVTDGVPTGLPPALRAFDRDDATSDLLRPLANATRSIDVVRLLLWAVAALILASVVYLSALERTRDFAVFKASGVSTVAVGAGLAAQAVVVALAASVVGAILALVIAPRFPMDVVITRRSLITLPAVAVATGLIASVVGVRRVVQAEPALAFGGP